jgi:hypothetical protein
VLLSLALLEPERFTSFAVQGELTPEESSSLRRGAVATVATMDVFGSFPPISVYVEEPE